MTAAVVSPNPSEWRRLASLGEQLASADSLRVLGPGQEISLAGSQVRGQDAWWYLVAVVFILLLFELVVLSWPHWRAWTGGAAGAADRQAGFGNTP